MIHLPQLLLVVASIFTLPVALIAAKPPKLLAIPAADTARSGPRELAFPGAEGFGAYARGGRGGPVLRVTTLEDNDRPGSLRWAVAQRGPRVIEFAVEGIVSLRKPLAVEEPYLTLDGSNAPGGGITLKDAGIRIVQTHDVVVRHLRVRPGDEAPLGKGAWRKEAHPNQGDAITVKESSEVTALPGR